MNVLNYSLRLRFSFGLFLQVSNSTKTIWQNIDGRETSAAVFALNRKPSNISFLLCDGTTRMVCSSFSFNIIPPTSINQKFRVLASGGGNILVIPYFGCGCSIFWGLLDYVITILCFTRKYNLVCRCFSHVQAGCDPGLCYNRHSRRFRWSLAPRSYSSIQNNMDKS